MGTMKNEKALAVGWGLLTLTLAMVMAIDASAQIVVPRPTVAVAHAEDMRLWSFGECDRRFPYVDSDQHKDCVQVVGSAEARDARALRVCEVSHDRDQTEIERCKSAYKANRERAVQDGVVPDAPAMPQAPPSEEMMRRVKALTSDGAEQKRAPGSVASPAAADAQSMTSQAEPESSSPMLTVGIVALAILLLGVGATVVRKKQAETA